MKLSELYRDLAYGELMNLALTDENPGEVDSLEQERVLSYVNQGLNDLSTKFTIIEKEVRIRLIPEKSDYLIHKNHADSNSGSAAEKYIEDTSDPFQNDLLRILNVYDELGNEFVLNVPDDEFSLFTPAYNIIQIPYDHPTSVLVLIYQSKFSRVQVFDPELDIQLPAFMEEPLRAYVGYKAYSNMNGPENIQKGQELFARYNELCAYIKEQDLTGESRWYQNHKLTERGFE